MPELPEVETVRRGLVPVLEGKRILRAEARRPDLRFPLPQRFAERLSGKRVERLTRRAKYILAELDSGETLLLHLGMSGRITIHGQTIGTFYHDASAGHGQPGPHDHVAIDIEGGPRITYTDHRRFGFMDLMPTAGRDGHKLLARLGPEPLGGTWDRSALMASLQAKRTPIKSALLDQHIVAGLGNIYVCEALYRARVSPLRMAASVTSRQGLALVSAVKTVLTEAIDAGGSTLRDFKHTDGDLGYFQHTFTVYDREGEACQTPRCTGTVERLVQSGRSTFYCPLCQR